MYLILDLSLNAIFISSQLSITNLKWSFVIICAPTSALSAKVLPMMAISMFRKCKMIVTQAKTNRVKRIGYYVPSPTEKPSVLVSPNIISKMYQTEVKVS
jgi:hypothetical protein